MIKVLIDILNSSNNKCFFIVSIYYDKTYTGANYRFEQLLNASYLENDIYFLSSISSTKRNHFIIPRFRSRLMNLILNQTLQLLLWNHFVLFDSPYLLRNSKHYLLVHDPGGVFPNLRRNNFFDSFFFRFFLFCSNNFVCVSEYTSSILKRFYSKSNTIVSYNGVDKVSFLVKEKEFDFLIISSGEKHKRDLQLISELILKYPNNKLVIVTRSQILKENFRALNNVFFYENISRDEICELYVRSKYYVNFSRMEGFGIPIIEALTYGSKLLISNIQVYHEILSLYNNQDMINDKVNFLNKKNHKIDIPNNLFSGDYKIKNLYYPVGLPSSLEWDNILKKLLFDIKCND